MFLTSLRNRFINLLSYRNIFTPVLLKRLCVLTAVLIIVILIQYCFLGNLRIFGARLNLVLCFIVFIGLNESILLSILISILAGFINSSFSILFFGADSLTFVLLVMLAQEVKKKIFTQGILVLSIMVYFGTWINFFVVKFYGLVSGGTFAVRLLAQQAFLEAILNCITMYVVFKLLKKCASAQFISLPQ
jgi:cell shape-determining protein MreD